MPAVRAFEVRLAQAWPPSAWQDVSVLVGVSGGPDSVALVSALRTLKAEGQGRLLAAHFNHRLRGPDAEADEAFVVGLCRDIGIPCEVGRASPHPNPLPKGEGTGGAYPNSFPLGEGTAEAAARQARYDFLQDAAARLGARYVVTAHTADDQAETILHRILRGTGIAGLAGMARARPLGPAATLIRPLLEVRRADVLGYLDQLGQAFRRDGTNEDRQFTRNRIRGELLPALAAQYNSGVIEALLRLGRLAGEVQSVVDAIVEALVPRAVAGVKKGTGPICAKHPPGGHQPKAGRGKWGLSPFPAHGQVRVLLDCLEGQPRYIVRELLVAVWRQRQWPLQAMGFDQWDLLAEMATPGPAGSRLSQKRMFPGGILAEVRGDELWLGPTRGEN